MASAWRMSSTRPVRTTRWPALCSTTRRRLMISRPTAGRRPIGSISPGYTRRAGDWSGMPSWPAGRASFSASPGCGEWNWC